MVEYSGFWIICTKKGEIGMKQKYKSILERVSIVIILAFLLTGCSNKGKAFYNTAMKEYSNGNYEAAADSFVKAIKNRNDVAEYYIDYGFCLIQLQQYQEASVMFQKAILEKESSIVIKNNKKAYRGLGIAAYVSGDYKKASEWLQRAMEYDTLKEYDEDILSYLGASNLALKNYKDAIENYTEVLKKNPKSTEAHVNRAKAYFISEDYEASINDYLEAKKQQPKSYAIYLGLYEAYKANHQMVEADAALEEATKLKPETPEDDFNLAKVLYYQGKADQAFSSFEEAGQNGYYESYLFLGDIYSERGDYENAVYFYEKYQEKANSQDAVFYDRLGKSYLLSDDYAKALTVIQKGLEIGNLSVKKSLLRNEIIAYEHLGDYESAYNKMTSYLKQYENDSDAIRDMEFLKTRQGQKTVSKSNEDMANDDIVKP